MSKNIKRPKWVWVILIWFMYAGLSACYQFYGMFNGTFSLPPGVQQPTGVWYYIQAFGFQFLYMVAAILLFTRQSAARFFFLALLILSVLSIGYTVLSGGIPAQYKAATLSIMAITLVIYALITRYCFVLLSRGYYKSTHNQQLKAGETPARDAASGAP